MGLTFYFSNQIEILLNTLSDNITKESQAEEDPFYKPKIIVPNSNLKKWIQMKIAERDGVAINLDFLYLENGLSDILSRFEKGEKKACPLNKQKLQLMVLAILLGDNKGNNELKPILNYFGGDSIDQTSQEYARKAWQLSDRLARYFREYEYHREKMIEVWRGGNKLFYEDSNENEKQMEICQRVIYKKIFDNDGIRDKVCKKSKELLYTLPQFVNKIDISNNNQKNSKIRVHIFCFSQISTFHIKLILNLSNLVDFNIYQLNFCDNFWEKKERCNQNIFEKITQIKSIGENEQEQRISLDESSVFQQWASPGIENIDLFNKLSKKNNINNKWFVHSNELAKTTSTVLQCLQSSINSSSVLNNKKSLDTSIQIIGCPGIYREAETVYNSIINNMKEDKDLKLTDIAVLVPNINKYKYAIKSVFTRNPAHYIPYNLSDSKASDDSLFGQAVIGLLELANSLFTRKEVFDLIFNPCFLEAFDIEREEALVWVKWADALNIFHDFEGKDQQYRDNQKNDCFTWHQGLQRLRLGRIMDIPEELPDNGIFKSYNNVVPFLDIESQTPESPGKFCRIIESLFVKLKKIKNIKCSSNEWVKIISELISDFLAIPKNRPEENIIHKKLILELKKIDFLDHVMESLNQDKRISLAFIIQYIKSILAEIPSGYGSYLTGGVTISSLIPMRPIPYKVVYVMGMGEKEFPGRSDVTTLDLRLRKRESNDVNLVEINRFLILETLLSVRKKIYFTYISRDLQKDEAFYTSVLLNQLQNFLNKYILKEDFKILEMPLKGNSIRYLDKSIEYTNIAHEEKHKFTDVLCNYSTPDRILCLTDLIRQYGKKERCQWVDKIEEIKNNRIPDFAAAEKEVERKEIEIIRIKDLKQFILNPIEATLKRFLNIYDEYDEDNRLKEDEAFYSEFPMDYQFITNMLNFIVKKREKEKQIDNNYSTDF
ncbi:MAG: exodeoxyribonuclease V subunit gamma, partial [Spirochaetes bacterium]|nr:exodeoxyribonuclease V subunit gamma [Spirochaetota bacterium]